MPQKRLRSRSLRHNRMRLPSGRRTVHYVKRPGSFPRCRLCGGILHGTQTSRIRKGPLTLKRPSRMFGGEICHSCLAERIRETVIRPVSSR